MIAGSKQHKVLITQIQSRSTNLADSPFDILMLLSIDYCSQELSRDGILQSIEPRQQIKGILNPIVLQVSQGGSRTLIARYTLLRSLLVCNKSHVGATKSSSVIAISALFGAELSTI